MFGVLNRQLARIIAKDKDREDGRAMEDRALEHLRKMGADRTGAQRPPAPEALDDLKEIIRTSDVRGFLRHVETHGSGTTQALSRQSEVLHDLKAKRQAAKARRADCWTSAQPPLSERQQSLLADLPDAALREQIMGRLRAGLIFDLEFRPATAQDRSFAGGTPVTGEGLRWPRDKRSGQPLLFIGQIDMRDLPDFPLRHHFPEAGALLFFAPQTPDTDGALVQHVSTHNAVEAPVPEDAVPYRSSFAAARAGTGECQTGWLHEAAAGTPPFRVLPKWPIAPRLSAFVPQSLDFYDPDFPIPKDLLAPPSGDKNKFYLAFGKTFNGLPEPVPSSEPEVFDAFPHVWGAIGDIAARFLPLVDKCIATNGLGTPEDVNLLRQELDAWRIRAAQVAMATPVSPGDRENFKGLMQELSAEGGVPLPSGKTTPTGAKHLNEPHFIADVLSQIQTFWVLSSLCTDPSTLPASVRQAKVAELQASFATKGHIQSPGHTQDVSGEETAFESVLLMQFPWSYITDVTGVFGFEGLRFWMSYDDFVSGTYDKACCSH